MQSVASHVRDIDEFERRFAQIEPIFIITYNSVLISILNLFVAFAPQVYRVPNPVLALGGLAIVLFSTASLNTMNKPGAICLSILAGLRTMLSFIIPFYVAFLFWGE